MLLVKGVGNAYKMSPKQIFSFPKVQLDLIHYIKICIFN